MVAKGLDLWDNIFLIGFMASPYAFLINWQVGLITVITFFLGFFSIKNAVLNKLYKKLMGLSFLITSIYRDRTYKEDCILAFGKKTGIDMGTVDCKEERWYADLRLRAMEKLEITKEELEEEDKNANSAKETNVKKMKKKQKKKKKTKKTEKEPEVEEIKNLPVAELEENAKNKLRTFNVDINEILNATLVSLYDGVSFQDSEKHVFYQCVILTRRPYEKEISFSEVPIAYQGYPINAQAAEVKLVCIGWIAHDFPIFYTVFTDEDAFDQCDATRINEAIHDLKLEIYRRMIYHYRRFFERFQLQIEESEDFLEEEKEHSSHYRQMLKNEREKYTDVTQETRSGIHLKSWQILILSFGWIFAALFGGFAFT